jgi:hypothetical protein
MSAHSELISDHYPQLKYLENPIEFPQLMED